MATPLSAVGEEITPDRPRWSTPRLDLVGDVTVADTIDSAELIAIARSGRMYTRPDSMPLGEWLKRLQVARDNGILSTWEMVKIGRESEGLEAEPKA